MAENKETIIIDVQINEADVAKKLGEATAKLQQLKEEQKALQKQLKDGEITAEEYGKAIAANKDGIERYGREVKNATALLQAANIQEVKNTDTLDDQRQALNTLQKAYGQLTEEQRNASVGGKTLTERIKDLSDSVKEQEAAIGDARRNVGNYTESITQAFDAIGKVGNDMKPAISVLRSMGDEGKKLGDILDMMGKLFAVVSKGGQAVATATTAQTAATKGATTAQIGLNTAMSANPIGAIITAITALLPLIQKFISMAGDASKEQAALNAELDRQNKLLEQAKADAEFQAQLVAATGANAKEQIEIRRKAAMEAVQIADDEVQRLLELKINGNRKERKAAEEALKGAIEAQKKAQEDLQALNNQATIEEVKAVKERADKKKKEREKDNADALAEEKRVAALRIEIERRTEDAMIALIPNETDKRVAEIQVASDREVQALRDKMATLADTELQARQEIANLIALKEEETQRQITDVLKQAEQEQAEELLQQRAEQFAQRALQDQNEYERRLQKAQGDEVALAEIELAQAQAENDTLLQMDEQTKQALFASQEEYESAIIASENAITAAREKAMQAALNRAQQSTALVGDAMGAIANIMDAFGAEEKEMAKLQKIMALGKIAVQTGIAIASGVAQAQAVPFPANIAAIVTTITAIMSNIATAVSTVKSAKFSGGGVVGGNSYSGDKVPISVNSAELISNPKQTANLLYEISNNPARGGLDYELLGETMANAVAQQAPPVLQYSEFAEFNEKRVTYNEIASI